MGLYTMYEDNTNKNLKVLIWFFQLYGFYFFFSTNKFIGINFS